MEADLLRLSAVGVGLAATVEQGDDWKEDRFIAWMKRMLTNDPEIFGICLAFEPDTFDPWAKNHPGRQPLAGLVPFGIDAVAPNRDGYTLYVWRKPDTPGHTAEPLTLQYNYRPRAWYRDTLSGLRAGWSDPYIDWYAHRGTIPVVSYTAPLRRRGDDRPIGVQPIGVLTVDLSLDYFERLGSWLKNPSFGTESYGFVLSATGCVIGHPHLGPNPLGRKDGESGADIRAVWPDPAFRNLVATILAHTGDDVGEVTGIDPATGRPGQFLFAKFKPAGWVFVAVIPAPQ
ncbi:MAG TPA: cache domain-containing protein [Gemmataceae bacterium]|nr:cache domain-containing protein [Gemmataceae bacterium]